MATIYVLQRILGDGNAPVVMRSELFGVYSSFERAAEVAQRYIAQYMSQDLMLVWEKRDNIQEIGDWIANFEHTPLSTTFPGAMRITPLTVDFWYELETL